MKISHKFATFPDILVAKGKILLAICNSFGRNLGPSIGYSTNQMERIVK